MTKLKIIKVSFFTSKPFRVVAQVFDESKKPVSLKYRAAELKKINVYLQENTLLQSSWHRLTNWMLRQAYKIKLVTGDTVTLSVQSTEKHFFFGFASLSVDLPRLKFLCHYQMLRCPPLLGPLPLLSHRSWIWPEILPSSACSKALGL